MRTSSKASMEHTQADAEAEAMIAREAKRAASKAAAKRGVEEEGVSILHKVGLDMHTMHLIVIIG